MLSHLYNRKPAQKPQAQRSNQEVDIINSFYEQRKARSFSAKQHNLLKKNISYFKQEVDQQNSFCISNQIQNHPKSVPLNLLRKPPLDLKHSNQLSHSLYQQGKKVRNRPSLPELLMSQYHSEESLSHYQVSRPLNSQLTDSQYRQHLKKQLNKRININRYLSQLNPNQKTEPGNLKKRGLNDENESNNQQDIYHKKHFDKFTSHHDRTQEKHPDSFLYEKQEQKRQRIASYQNLQKKRKITNQSKNSKESQYQQPSKCYQLSKNQFTDRTQVIRHTFGSQKSQKHRKSSLSQESANRSANQNSNKSQKQINRLNSQQLTQLHYNSHPLRQTTNLISNSQPLKLKYNYFDPQLQAHYKRRIQDLQGQIRELKDKHKRQQKLIESIVKMRRTIQGISQQEDDYSLKQLWRWIKQLPAKHY